jgi:hypothetical protein
MEDRREHERFDMALPARIAMVTSEGECILDALTADICAGGAFFHTEEIICVGTAVVVDLKVGRESLKELSGSNTLIRVTGRVARSDSAGTAIIFDKNYQIQRL